MKTFAALLLFMTLATAQANLISSNSSGGNWEDNGTWVGGTIPGASDDVTINGIVSVTSSNSTCHSITITSGAVLQNGGGLGWVTLHVTNNVTNNGTIRNNPTANTFGVEIGGSIINNSVWQQSATYLIGSQNQSVTLATGMTFDGYFHRNNSGGYVDTTGTLSASSDLVFTCIFDMQWRSFDMAHHALTIRGNMQGLSWGTILNASSITLQNEAYFTNVTIQGACTIQGSVQVDGGTAFNGNITIADSLMNHAGLGWVTLIALHNITNNGVVCNNPRGNLLDIEVDGDLTNNATWHPDATELAAHITQTLSLAAGKTFDGTFQRTANGGWTDSAGTLKAGTNLVFTNQFDMEWFSFDMAGYALTINGAVRGLSWGTILNATNITLHNGAYFTNVTVKGNFTLHGEVLIDGATTFDGNATVSDSLMNNPGLGWVTLVVLHNITNNGVVCNNPRGNLLDIEVHGNIVNNGVWNASDTYLPGTQDQTLALTAGNIFEGKFHRNTSGGYIDTTGMLRAASDLVFSNSFDMQWRSFDMAGFALTIGGGERGLSWGTILNTASLTFIDGAYLTNVVCVGTVVLHGTATIDGNVHFSGSVTVADTMQATTNLGSLTVTFNGAVINNGVVRNNPAGNGLYVDITGDIINNGLWLCATTNLDGLVKRTVQLAGAQTQVRVNGEKVMFTGFSEVPNLVMTGSSVAIVTAGATLVVESGPITYGKLFSNYGRVVFPMKTTAGTRDYDFFGGHLQFANAVPDSVIVETYGYQSPAIYGNAVRTWWRVRTVPAAPIDSLTIFRVNYSTDQIGTNDEAALQMMQSHDAGASWTQISSDAKMTRDTAGNSISLLSAAPSGDFVLTSHLTPAAGKPNVTVTIIARDAVRIGRPNRCIVYLVNNSDTPVDDFLVAVNTGSKTHILSAELPTGAESKEIYPIDSLLFDGGVDSCATFYVAGLGGHEDATFDVMVSADATTTTLHNGNIIQFEPVSMVVGAVVVYVGVKVIDYIGDKAVEHINSWDVLTPEQQKAAKQLGIGQAQQELHQEKSGGKTVWVLKKVGGKITEKLMGAVSGTVDVAAAIMRNIGNVGTSMRTKMWQWFYRESGLYGVEETQSGSFNPEYTGSAKSMRAVTSCDPNEKVGPSGFSDAGYISSIGPMEYTIFFTNKIEATAPAENIVILDTLNTNFDPSTVVFGRASHAGFVTTQTDNILRWEITGIELPPDSVPPEGEGYVTFTVTPRAGLPSGTLLKNRSTVIFDANAPIATNEYSNTLDFLAPTTSLNALPAQINANRMNIKWNATDPQPGSGADAVTVFMSDNGGGFVPVGVAGASDSLAVPITHSGHYAFYALSRDMVGNVEQTPSATYQTDVTVSGVDENILPASALLINARPVPTWGPVEIDVTTDRASVVSIALYNVLGERVARLYEGMLDAGSRAFAWDGSAQPAGTYRAVVTTLRGVRSATVIVVR